MKQYKKIMVIKVNDKQMLQERLIETDGYYYYKTVKIIRERPATIHEELVYCTGYGSNLKF